MLRTTGKFVRGTTIALLLGFAPVYSVAAKEPAPIEARIENLKAGQYVWQPENSKSGEVEVVIGLNQQMAYVYRGDALVGVATVSTAKKGHVTPLGEWSILEKRPFYRSKKYNNAPMPWMQRIDEYGIALHGGGTPGYPESHGCIHLPNKFAEKLFKLTKVGSKVIIEG